jgi:hypothetical protein
MRKKSKQFNLRLSPEMHAWIKAEAAKNLRTLNSQVNKWILEAKERETTA